MTCFNLTDYATIFKHWKKKSLLSINTFISIINNLHNHRKTSDIRMQNCFRVAEKIFKISLFLIQRFNDQKSANTRYILSKIMLLFRTYEMWLLFLIKGFNYQETSKFNYHDNVISRYTFFQIYDIINPILDSGIQWPRKKQFVLEKRG